MSIDLKNKNVQVSIIGMTAALYTILGYLVLPLSFMGLQFRVAELMVGICIIFPISGLIGNVLGVFFVNLSSPLGVLDIIIMPLVNIPALYCIILLRNKKIRVPFQRSEENWFSLIWIGGILYAIIISIGVAWLLNFILAIPFWIMFLQVFAAEFILTWSSITLFIIIRERLNLQED
jgi:uncharacterized membrane protein